MTVNCHHCNKTINRKPSYVKAYKLLFCDRGCHAAHRNSIRTTRFPKSLVYDIYVTRQLSFRQAAKMLDITERTFRKLLIDYNISIKAPADAIRAQWYNNPERRLRQAESFVQNIQSYHRDNPTPAEQIAIERLSGLGIEYNFQFAFGRYILDFYIPGHSLVIEIDDESHNYDKDHERDSYIRSYNLEVVRIPNQDVSIYNFKELFNL